MTTPCRFKAQAMLETRRAVASNPALTPLQISIVVELIDEARHTHFDSTGCTCWQTAIQKAGVLHG